MKRIHFKLPSHTVLQEDEKSVIFFLFILCFGKIDVNLSYKEIRVLKGSPASCFSAGPSHWVQMLSFW